MPLAAQLDDALGHRGSRPVGRQALEAAIDPAIGGITIGISHDAGTHATKLALEAAREGGATTALITANPDGPLLEAADLVAMTPAQDTSWCHTIGYLSPMVAGAVIAGVIANKPVDGNALRSHLEECLTLRSHAAEIATNLKGIDRLIVVGGGYDRISADELVLKVEEGLHLPSAARDLEMLAICKAADTWPGYSDQIEPISLPAWMRPGSTQQQPPTEIELY